MENTRKAQFTDTSAVWFICFDEQWVGPLSAEEVYQQIQKGYCTWAHFAWRNLLSNPERICNLGDFASVVPGKPNERLKMQVRELAKPKIKHVPVREGGVPEFPKEDRKWFLLNQGVQMGPYTDDEVRRLIRTGKSKASDLCWRDGLTNWEPFSKQSEFEDITQEIDLQAVGRTPGSTSSGINVEMRGAPRKPLVAKILLSNQDSLITGVCRDISVGGMQILTPRLPGKVGEVIRVNVSPSDKGVTPFAAEGWIVRILEDGLGFSFRFKGLSDDARKSIEEFIA